MIQKKYQREHPLLYSLPGFRYCDLLLGKGNYGEVQEMASHAIEIAERNKQLLSIGLDHLSLGEASLLQALNDGTGDHAQGAGHLNQAADWLRRAGQQDDLSLGLMARAELYIALTDFDKARRDLDEAMTIAQRGEMGFTRNEKTSR